VTDKVELVGTMLVHTLLGVEMLHREAGDWDYAESYGGRLFRTMGHLRAACDEFRLAQEVRPADG
jgi:hypothetical protein